MNKHTPGPWVWTEHHLVPESEMPAAGEYPGCVAIADDGSAYGEYNQTCKPESANGRLIAAAPCLLEALDLLLAKAYKQNFNDAYPEILAKAEAAIAKARGEQ